MYPTSYSTPWPVRSYQVPLHRLVWFALYLRNNNLASKENGRDTVAGVRHQHNRFSTSHHQTVPLIGLLFQESQLRNQ